MINLTNIQPHPKTAAILITYQCVAQCDECCFACNPHLTNTAISYEKVKTFLDQVAQIKTIKVVVFSGGECFIEFDLLKRCISYATSLGLATRCVSNGYWGINLKVARRKVAELKEAGLTEINFSTGDSHQQFAPVERVLYSSIASLEAGIRTCIAVETNNSKKFTADDFKLHPLYKEYIEERGYDSNILVMPTVWVSFHTDNIYDFGEKPLETEKNYGCDGVFDTVALEPRTDIVGCCGLTVNNIDEMHLGELKSDNLRGLFIKHYNDFMKIWIFVDGPKKIVEISSEWAGETMPRFAHKCLYCAYLYNNEDLLSQIVQHYKEIKDGILTRYEKKTLAFNAL